MSTHAEVSRRTVLKLVGGAGATLALGCFPISAATRKGDKTGVTFAPNAFIRVQPDGMIDLTVSKSDMGQGIRTSLAMIIAEELDADWSKVRVFQAPADSKFGGQGTGGSSSTRSMYGNLRKVGAGARQMIVEAAAKQWNVDASTLTTSKGVVHGPGGKTLAYGDLTAAASTMTPPTEIKTKSKADFKIIGHPTNRVDNHDVVTGKAMYGQDVKVPGMVYAVISRQPAFGAKYVSMDATAAKKVAGVLDVVEIPSGVAVIATNTWAAMKGRKALKVTWDAGPNAELDSKKISGMLKAAVGEHMAMPADAKVVQASIEFPFLAHATMEPMNAVADVQADKCTVWSGVQGPDGLQGSLARMLKLEKENVVVNVPLLGGGFGRRIMSDFVTEAVQISQKVKKPVKLLWSRDDDMRNDFYRPAGYASFKGAIDANGNPVAWSHWAVQSSGRGSGKFGPAGLAYDIENSGMAHASANVPVPTGFWRSVENTLEAAAMECFMDELAQAAGKDPFEFRRALVKNARLKHVLETAAEKGDWGKPLPAGHGRGIACFGGYGSYAAHVVEASVVDGKVKLHRVVAVVDCGLAINPKGVEAQVQGACVDAMSTSLKSAITLDKGQVEQTSYFDYDWTRIDEIPKIEVHILETSGEPGGMGEVGYPSMPPAIANAVHAITGKRVRKFPIKLEELA